MDFCSGDNIEDFKEHTSYTGENGGIRWIGRLEADYKGP